MRSPDFVDVRELRARVTVDELNRKAEEYFSRLSNTEYQLSKPFASIDESPELLISFAQVLAGLALAPGMTVMDFGAGSCWTSRYLSQLGIHVIALDASASALRIGQDLFLRNPVIGDRPPPRFLHYDGRTIDVASGSVDRIVCIDAFHHVPNPDRVLEELARVLVSGGIAGFSEPGPTHSQQSQSQYEMRTHGVLENDIEMGDIWEWARKAGFSAVRLALFSAAPCHVSLEEFQHYVNGGPLAERVRGRMHQEQLKYLQTHRLFFLQKAGELVIDSRQRMGLSARLDLFAPDRTVRHGDRLAVHGKIINVGKARWLPASAPIGGVKLGVHLLDAAGNLLNLDHHRHHLTPDPGRAIESGEEIAVTCRIPLPGTPGRYLLEIDLVSEGVVWFAQIGTAPVRMAVELV